MAHLTQSTPCVFCRGDEPGHYRQIKSRRLDFGQCSWFTSSIQAPDQRRQSNRSSPQKGSSQRNPEEHLPPDWLGLATPIIMRYSVVIHKDRDSDYGVTVPDLPGFFSAGDTADEAFNNAIEAIECHIEGLLIDGERIPQGKPIEHHRENREFASGIWALVDVDLSKLSGKAKRVNITLPERILKQIDSFALRSGDTRSGLLLLAALEYVSAHSEDEQRRSS